MGRGIQSEPPVSAEYVRQHFVVGLNSGELLRRDCTFGPRLAGEPATYRNEDRDLRVRLTYNGKRRTMTATRLAWILATGEHPKGKVKTIGDENDFRFENLLLTKHGAHRPQANAGRASSLERRQRTTAALLNALAERANPSLSELSEAIGLSEGRVSTRLNKLAAAGLAQSPMCVPGRSWCLSVQGQAMAKASVPVVIDDLDRAVLMVIARSPSRLVAVAQQVDVCHFTARRRLDRLIEHGMVDVGESRRFQISAKGRALLGDAMPERWVKTEAVAASLARDVVRRLESPSDLSPDERSRLASQTAHKARAARIGRPREGKWAYQSAVAG